MLVELEYIFWYKTFNLEFGTHVINIKMIVWKKFILNKQFFSPQEGIKVGSSKIISHNSHVGKF